MNKKKPLIQSLDRALDILELVRDSSKPLRSKDIAARMGMRVATTNNILRSLYQRGYLAQDENSRYALGAECFKLRRGVSDEFAELRRVVSAPVRELADKTGDTTFFGCEYYGNLYCVAMSVGGGQLVVSNTQNWLELLHCTAAGKVIIAERGVAWYERICGKRKPLRLASRTIVDLGGMECEIEKIKRDGFALCVRESGEEIAAIGVAVYNRAGELAGALAQCFPAVYLESGRIEPLARSQVLRRYADEMKKQM